MPLPGADQGMQGDISRTPVSCRDHKNFQLGLKGDSSRGFGQIQFADQQVGHSQDPCRIRGFELIFEQEDLISPVHFRCPPPPASACTEQCRRSPRSLPSILRLTAHVKERFGEPEELANLADFPLLAASGLYHRHRGAGRWPPDITTTLRCRSQRSGDNYQVWLLRSLRMISNPACSAFSMRAFSLAALSSVHSQKPRLVFMPMSPLSTMSLMTAG